MTENKEGRRVSAMSDLAFKKALATAGNEDVLAGLIKDFYGIEPEEYRQ
jgi:hypothetical protein